SILAEGTIGQGEMGRMIACFAGAEKGYEAVQARDAADGLPIAPAPVNMYRAEVESFSQAVLDDTDPPVGADLGLWSQKVLAACYKAAETGRPVLVRSGL
ncbi:MAG: hypothetical protein NTU83_01670, partial [Candidatus Hydrogenedentes bacterium]|nr:hypothetical protein [Candidatus Hydrogenedentota bacterium]